MSLLGTDDDEAIAAKLGRSCNAVMLQRTLRRIPAHSGWVGGGRGWTKKELALLGTDTDEAIAERLGRSVGAVMQKRCAMKVPTFRDRRRG